MKNESAPILAVGKVECHVSDVNRTLTPVARQRGDRDYLGTKAH